MEYCGGLKVLFLLSAQYNGTLATVTPSMRPVNGMNSHHFMKNIAKRIHAQSEYECVRA